MVEYITYKEEKYPIRVSNLVLKNFEKETGYKLFSQDNEREQFFILFYYAIKQGYKIESKEFNFTREETEEILDEVYYEFQSIVLDSLVLMKDEQDKFNSKINESNKKK